MVLSSFTGKALHSFASHSRTYALQEARGASQGLPIGSNLVCGLVSFSSTLSHINGKTWDSFNGRPCSPTL